MIVCKPTSHFRSKYASFSLATLRGASGASGTVELCWLPSVVSTGDADTSGESKDLMPLVSDVSDVSPVRRFFASAASASSGGFGGSFSGSGLTSDGAAVVSLGSACTDVMLNKKPTIAQ